MRSRTRMDLRTLATVVAVAGVVTPIFNVLTNETGLEAAGQGVVDGMLIAILVGTWVLFVRGRLLRVWLRRHGFVANLLLNVTALVLLFLLGRGVGQLVASGDPERFVSSFSDPHLLWATPFFAVFSFVLVFLLQMNRMIGTNVLRYFVAGVYHQPVEEERVFLFLDLEGSTRMAEQLGSERYYRLLRSFVDDLSDPIVETAGEIYQYAGDEVVIVWPLRAGIRDGNCVRCFFLIGEAIDARADAYRREFGVVPRFRAGLHGGTVTAGELGDLKQQIVFVGDILNTAARLEEYAKRTDHRLVASGELLDRLTLPPGIRADLLEELQPRGKSEKVTVHALAGGLAPA